MDEIGSIRPIALLTDFGLQDSYVGVMKGVIQTISPGACQIDLSHEIPPQDLLSARFLLEKSWRFFPEGTVLLCVVDPGVGTDRRAIAVENQGRFFVGPDNGILSPILEGGMAVCIEDPQYRLAEVSNTFQGRDLFAPAAAHLSRGVPLSRLGRVCHDPITLPTPLPRRVRDDWVGEIVYVDRFGNLITPFEGELFLPFLESGAVRVETAAGVVWPFECTYAHIPCGDRCAVVGGYGTLELAINRGNAALISGLGTGSEVTLHKC